MACGQPFVCELLDLGPDIKKTWGRFGLAGRAHRRNLGIRAITNPTVLTAFDDAEGVVGAVAERWVRHHQELPVGPSAGASSR